MSATWDSKDLKVTPLAADEVLIIDTADSRNQKRATLGSIESAIWTRNAGILSPTIPTDAVSILGNLTVDTTTFFVDSANNRVGVGITLPTAKFHVVGDIKTSTKILAGNGTGPFPTHSFTNGIGFGMWHDSVTPSTAFSVNGFDALRLTADANASTFLSINAGADSFGEGDVTIKSVSATSTDLGLIFESGIRGVDINVGTTGAAVNIGRNDLAVFDSTGTVTISLDETLDGKFIVTQGNINLIPGDPKIEGTKQDATNLNTPRMTHISGDFAFVTSQTGDSLTIIDVSMDSAPSIVGTLIDNVNLNGARDVFVAGQYAYVACFEGNSLTVIDISIPSAPTFVSKITVNGAYAIAVTGVHAYVIDKTGSRLIIIDIHNPTALVQDGVLTDAVNFGNPTSIYVLGRFAYITGELTDSLAIVDILDDDNPTVTGSLIDDTNMNSPQGVFISGNHAYVVSNVSDSLAIIDTSTPSNPTLTSSLVNPSFELRVAFAGTVVSGGTDYTVGDQLTLVGGTFSEVTVFNVDTVSGGVVIAVSVVTPGTYSKSPANPVSTTGGTGTGCTLNVTFLSKDVLEGANQIFVSKNHAYVSSGIAETVTQINIQNPSTPGITGVVSSPTVLAGVNSVFAVGKHVYVTSPTNNSFSIIDLHGVDTPTARIGNIETGAITVLNDVIIGGAIIGSSLNVGYDALVGGQLSVTKSLTSFGDLTVANNILHVDVSDGSVQIGGTTVAADFSIVQQTTQAKRGMLLTGNGFFGGNMTADGVFISNILNAAGNMQLGIGQLSDFNNVSKNIFRYTVGIPVPNIGGVSGNGALNTHINLGNLISNVGVGFDVTSTPQSAIQANLHVKAGGVSKTAQVIDAFGTQTVDIFQIRNSSKVRQIYVDKDFNLNVTGLLPFQKWKEPVQLATIANVTLTGEQTIDGILTSTSRILVKNQTVPADNGIYVTASGAWVRAFDFDGNDEVSGSNIRILEGTLNSTLTYKLTNTTTPTIGSTALTLQDHNDSPGINIINSAGDFEALATAGVITQTNTSRTLKFKTTIATATRFSITGISGSIKITEEGDADIFAYANPASPLFTVVGGDIVAEGIAFVNPIFPTPVTFMDFQGQFLGILTDRLTLDSAPVVGFNLGTLKRQKGGLLGPTLLIQNGTTFVNWTDSLNLDGVFAAIIKQFGVFSTTGVSTNKPVIVIKDSAHRPGQQFSIGDVGGNLLSGETLVRLDAGLPNDQKFLLKDSQIDAPSGLFDTSGATGNFTVVANNSIAATAITGVTDSGGIASFTHAGTSPLLGSTVTISGFVSNPGYNQTGIVTARTATTFEVDVIVFGTNETVGSYLVNGVTITATAHGLTLGTGVTLDTTLSTMYDGGFLIYNIQTNSFDVAAIFDTTIAGTWSTKGLDQKDPRVLAFGNPGSADSKSIASAFVNNNSEPSPIAVNNTFNDIVFGTAGDALIRGSNMERWKLIDAINGIFECISNEPHDGFITSDYTGITNNASATEFRFKWQIDRGSGFVDLPDPVEALVAIKSEDASISKTFPLFAVKGDQIKPQITRNAGAATITILYATIYSQNP